MSLMSSTAHCETAAARNYTVHYTPAHRMLEMTCERAHLWYLYCSVNSVCLEISVIIVVLENSDDISAEMKYNK